ncbi:MAG: carboxypeptidase M32 [Planctomycetes bacterium]|nr:carboxypeptidase M32 [Planctomycetota bacterium]
MNTDYDTLISLVKEANTLSSVESLLDWDSETYMPERGLVARAEQLSLMAALSHQKRTDPRIGELLGKVEAVIGHGGQGRPPHSTEQSHHLTSNVQIRPAQLSGLTCAANVREIRRGYDRAVKIPEDLIRKIAKASTLAKDAWGKARADNDYAAFAPHLSMLLDLKRKVADCIGYKGEPYDALLDEFEPGMTAAEVGRVFDSLRGPLSEFVKRLANAPRQPDASILHRHFPRAAQEKFGKRMAEVIGFDFKAGRLDVSKHPFCSGTSPGDVRLTTRYYEDFFSPSVFGVLHEAGHGLYEQGLPAEHLFTPMCQATSLGIHESQSRMWENFVGRSRAFWERFFGEAQGAFPAALGDVSLDAFVGAINTVQPSLIRVEADEVTYNLHIILRFELERQLISGTLTVKDVPAAWNAKMTELLGVTPATDREGCLQDIHWSMGAFGYFPTYALGNLYAAQFFAAAGKAIPDLQGCIRRGEFLPLLTWLRENIHRHGQMHRAPDLVLRVTGAPLSIEPFLAYVKGKFGPIYGLVN